MDDNFDEFDLELKSSEEAKIERIESRDVIVDSPLLKRAALALEFGEDQPYEDYEEVVESLRHVANRYQLRSLTATEIGIDAAITAVRNNDDVLEFFGNPTIVSKSDEQVRIQERCICFPGFHVWINRSIQARVRYVDPVTGVKKTSTLVGYPAFALQHEMTHINGIMFWDQANWFNRMQAKNRLRKLRRAYEKYKIQYKDLQQQIHEVKNGE